MKFNKNEEAVSPVIGVILMVAITVILAAVIAVFVFGMADNIQTSHTVTVTAKMTGIAPDILVTYQGGPDANLVEYLNVTAYDKDGAAHSGLVISGATGTTSTDATGTTKWTDVQVGQALKMASVDSTERIVVIAYFRDGTNQMILNKQF